MTKKYVFDLLPNGQSDIVLEQDITDIPELGPGFKASDLWMNSETPSNLSRPGDPTAGKAFLHEPPDGGAILRIIEFMPEGSGPKVDVRSFHQDIGSVHIPSAEDLAKAKHHSMHKTDTLNYFVLLTGQLWALSEGRDVLMAPGDVLVQKGCMHGWRNDGTEAARLFCVLVDATWETPAP